MRAAYIRKAFIKAFRDLATAVLELFYGRFKENCSIVNNYLVHHIL